MTPTGSWPRIEPGLTGYSPRTMCTSVPQIVVAVMRMTASPDPAVGRGTSSTAIWSFPWNTTAFIVRMGHLLKADHRVASAYTPEGSTRRAARIAKKRRGTDGFPAVTWK